MYGGLSDCSTALLRNQMDMLARPQLRVGCHVDVFAVGERGVSDGEDSTAPEVFGPLRKIVEAAGATLAEAVLLRAPSITRTGADGRGTEAARQIAMMKS